MYYTIRVYTHTPLKKNGEPYIRPNKNSEVYYQYYINQHYPEALVCSGKISKEQYLRGGGEVAIAKYHGITNYKIGTTYE